ncbi:hypothetical protein BDZ89DRAFT_157939 [Hymenopellis radicata]|nr:hypothetical protein BDZ89DRAFT_157939 [Hymenopellis radicata]
MASSGSTAGPRLLANLLSHEKDYAKALGGVVDASGAACTALLLYQPWLNDPRPSNGEEPPGNSVIHSLAVADAGLRTYTAAVETYVEGLKELRDLEDGVRNLVRDREILVTRVLKTSNKSSNRDSIFSAPSPSHSTVSLDSYSGKTYSAFGGKTSKLAHWQSELHGCESQLAAAQRELELKRISAVRDGLRLRATAMVECGARWTEAGRAILQLETTGAPLPLPPLQDFLSNINKPLPDDASSLTPSQSASQLEADVDLHIPPAHAIADLGLPTSTPHVLSRRITEEELGGGSSSSDEDEVEVVDNPRFGARSSKQKDAPPVSARRDESPSKSRFFGSIRGLFGHTKTAPSISGDPEDSRAEEKPPKPRKVKTWDTRTDKNLRKAEPVVVAGNPSTSALDVSTPRARRLRKDSPDKQQRRRSASVDGAFPIASSSAGREGSTPVPKRKSTKKKRVTGETSPSSGLSRNSSITSAPATFSPRATSPVPPLPSVNRVPSHKRQLSLSTHTPVTTRTERRVSSPSVQSHSLMSIVEDVARVNRSENNRGRERTLSGGLVSVKAPQSFSKKEIDGLPLENFLPGARERTTSSFKSKASKITTLFDVKAPASPIREHIEGLPVGSIVLASSSTAHSAPSPHASKSATPAPVASPSNAAASSSGSSPPAPSSSSPLPRPPLRSALRNGGSRTPSPMSSAGRAPSPVKGLLVVQAPSPLHAVANTASSSNFVPEVVQTKSFSPPVQPKSLSPIPSSLLEDDDDTASISSYETTHEMFDDTQDEATPKPAPASPAPPPPDKEYIVLSPSAPNGAVHIQNGTDVSISSDSTVNNGTPKRRKSVRVSLRPTFSATPPAIEYEEWHPSENTVIGETEAESSHGKRNGWKDGEPPDMWQDSSDEDEEYSTARRLLNRVAKKQKKARGG